MSPRTARFVRALLAGVVLVLSAGASVARPAAPQVTISLLTVVLDQPAYEVLIANFERVYPNVTVNATYASTSNLIPLEETELAAGNAPDLLDTAPGCGAPNAICDLANAGYLLPLVKEPWVKRSLRAVTSSLKHGQGLFGFQPAVAPFGVFTNDSLFGKLGLKVPQTFSQLLALCRTAQADGTTAVILPGTASSPSSLVYELATASLYGHDKNWNAKLRAGSATFAGTAGWHQALQEMSDMSNADCFEPGVAAESGPASTTLFAGGGGLMDVSSSSALGQIVAAQPSFSLLLPSVPGRHQRHRDEHVHQRQRRAQHQRPLERPEPGSGERVHRLRRAPQARRAVRAAHRRADPVPVPEAADPELHVVVRRRTETGRLRDEAEPDLVERECLARAHDERGRPDHRPIHARRHSPGDGRCLAAGPVIARPARRLASDGVRRKVELDVDGRTVSAEVRESRRARRLRMVIRPGGPLEVTVPRGTAARTLRRFVDEHADWIRERLDERPEAVLGLERPGTVAFAGEHIPVVGAPGERSTAALRGGVLEVSGRDPAEAVGRWYRREARRLLEASAEREAARLGLTYARIAVRDQRTRWGSCSTRGTLSFSWRLALAPPEILDYVVVHELLHLREHNHSPAFWHLLDVHRPGWRAQAGWLRAHAWELQAYIPLSG